MLPKDLEEVFNNNELVYIKRDLEGITYIDYMRAGCQMIQASKEDIFSMDNHARLGFMAGAVIFSYLLYADILRENTYLSRTVEVQNGRRS